VLLDSVFVGRDGKVLGRAVSSIDPVGEAKAGEGDWVEACEAVGGDLDVEGVGVAVDVGMDVEIFWVAEAMDVFIAETGSLPSVKVLHERGEEDEMVAKFGDDPFGFEIAGIDKEFDGVPFSVVGLSNLLERVLYVKEEREFFKIPGRVYIGKRFFIE
jgi:hypothetical protein